MDIDRHASSSEPAYLALHLRALKIQLPFCRHKICNINKKQKKKLKVNKERIDSYNVASRIAELS